MTNLAITLGNAIVNATPKVARRAKYLMQEVTSNVSTVEHTATATARKLKYQQPPTSEVTTDMLEWLQNSSATRRIVQNGKSGTVHVPSVRPSSINPAKPSATVNIQELIPRGVKPVSLSSEQIRFFTTNLNGISKSELEKAVSEITSLHHANGGLYYTTELSSKRGYSTRALLDARFNDVEHYNDILELIKLNNAGKIKYYPKLVMPNGHTNPLIKQDMKAIAEGRNYFEQFTSLNKSEILSKTSEGDVFSVGQQMFVRDSKGWQPLKMDKSTYELLFPPVDRYAMAQGCSENCGAIAVINNMVQVPSNRVKMLQLFEQNGNKVTVHALGDTSSKMTFDLNNLKTLDDGILSDSSYGLKMLERKGQVGNGSSGYHWPDYQERKDKFFGSSINKTPIEYMSDTPLWLSLEQKVKELSTIGKGRTYVSGGGGNYSLGTGDAHWCSVYDYHNGKIRFANPNATGDYQDVPISDFADKYLGIGAFHNH